MMKYVLLLIVATLAAAIFALDDVVGVDNTAHAQAGTPSNVSATNGANPGEAVVSWDPVAGASEYRVGWLAVADYQANIDNDRWRERFAYSDVNANSSYTVTRLTPGVVYYFITGRKEGNDIVWSAWATLTLNSGALSCPTQPTVAPSTTSALRVANGSNPGEVVVSWDVVAGTTGYRVGWLAVPDYQANLDNDRWRERFTYSDIGGGSSYTVTRLTPGIAYYFIVGRKQGDDITWSQWSALALTADAAACPLPGATTGTTTTTPTQTFPASAVGGDYDHDDDGLIEVRSLAQLAAIGLDMDGNSLMHTIDLARYLAAFPGALDNMGCPVNGCKGYELAASLDFDTNGNGEADAGDDHWNGGAGWRLSRTSGDGGLSVWYGTFDGNHYSISNMYINGYGGLFPSNGGAIRNVVLYGVNVTGGGRVGGLVGYNSGTISGSTVSGSVSGNDDVGGLVGYNSGTISGSTVSGSVSGNDDVGGLVGRNEEGNISGSTTSGTVSGGYAVGGLVGRIEEGDISGSTASGAVSGGSAAGGLVGYNSRGTISGSTASGDVSSGNNNVGGLVGYNWQGSVSGGAASGTVSGNDNVGGLVGYNSGGGSRALFSSRPGLINGSEAVGDATGRFYVGGLVGLNKGHIGDSTASGNVAGVRWRGPLVGANDGGTITNSTGTGTISTRQ